MDEPLAAGEFRPKAWWIDWSGWLEGVGLARLIRLLLCRLPRAGKRNAMNTIKHSVSVLPCMALNLIRAADVATAAMRDTTKVPIGLATFFKIGDALGSSSLVKEKPADVSWQVRSCVQPSV